MAFLITMNKLKKDEKFLMKILIVSALIIFFISLEAIILAKDYNNFNEFRKNVSDISYDDYLNLIIMNMFLGVLNPIIISLYTFFTIKKYGINNIYKMFFGFATVLSLANIILQFRIKSIFYYLVIILHLILFYFIVSKERT